VYASSSSVYGGNTVMPFSEHHGVDHPVSLYAATKKANELMAHTYSHLFNLPTTGLRFFTVYGPWGRPDMALFLFTRPSWRASRSRCSTTADGARLHLHRRHRRRRGAHAGPPATQADPGYDKAAADTASSWAPYKVFNIGNHDPVPLMDFIAAIERHTGKVANKVLMDIQPGDVPATYADVAALEAWTGFKPATSIDDGVGRFVAWYRSGSSSNGLRPGREMSSRSM
jgi:UDP-glucuronate 4-epimerase